MDQFSIERNILGAAGIQLQFKGALDRTASQSLQSEMDFLPKGKGGQLCMDFSQLRRIDGEGLILFIIFSTRAAAQGFTLQAEKLSPELRLVFDLADLASGIQINGNVTQKPGVSSGWYRPVDVIECCHVPEEANNLNVHGRKPTSPLQGFGRMWLRSYRIALAVKNTSTHILMDEWKARFGEFWPTGNAIYTPENRIFPGAVGLINLSMPLGLRLATGAVVIYEDDTSFTFMTVQGHMFSGFINFNVYEENGIIYAQTQALVRPNDLLYEISFWTEFGPKAEDAFWVKTLENLGQFLDLKYASLTSQIDHEVKTNARLINSAIQWRFFSNIWYNAGVRSGIHQIVKPFRRINKEA